MGEFLLSSGGTDGVGMAKRGRRGRGRTCADAWWDASEGTGGGGTYLRHANIAPSMQDASDAADVLSWTCAATKEGRWWTHVDPIPSDENTGVCRRGTEGKRGAKPGEVRSSPRRGSEEIRLQNRTIPEEDERENNSSSAGNGSSTSWFRNPSRRPFPTRTICPSRTIPLRGWFVFSSFHVDEVDKSHTFHRHRLVATSRRASPSPIRKTPRERIEKTFRHGASMPEARCRAPARQTKRDAHPNRPSRASTGAEEGRRCGGAGTKADVEGCGLGRCYDVDGPGGNGTSCRRTSGLVTHVVLEVPGIPGHGTGEKGGPVRKRNHRHRGSRQPRTGKPRAEGACATPRHVRRTAAEVP
mmetsp:Transcript_8360/g.52124  ORF Transcript_8360/g.52124 Transcript_8360/m.52124 type:complete len:356 (-) Transcript_8360:3315-4382(-)